MALDQLGPCLEWRGVRTAAGYGNYPGTGTYVHRLAYCDARGIDLAEIRELVVRHKCDNPSCFHPEHLETGTQADNMRDMWERGRARLNPQRGEKNGFARLTEEAVRYIRTNYVRGSRDQGLKSLAERFGVCQGQISNVVKRKQWAHVGEINAAVE